MEQKPIITTIDVSQAPPTMPPIEPVAEAQHVVGRYLWSVTLTLHGEEAMRHEGPNPEPSPRDAVRAAREFCQRVSRSMANPVVDREIDA